MRVIRNAGLMGFQSSCSLGDLRSVTHTQFVVRIRQTDIHIPCMLFLAEEQDKHVINHINNVKQFYQAFLLKQLVPCLIKNK